MRGDPGREGRCNRLRTGHCPRPPGHRDQARAHGTAVMIRLLASFVTMIAALLLVAAFWVALRSMERSLPPIWRVEDVVVSLARGGSVVIGHEELGQKPGPAAAEREHI